MSTCSPRDAGERGYLQGLTDRWGSGAWTEGLGRVWETGCASQHGFHHIPLWKFNLFLKRDGADRRSSSLPGFSDKLDFLEGDQKPVARSTKDGAKGQQMKRGYVCSVLSWRWCVRGPAQERPRGRERVRLCLWTDLQAL